MSEQNEPSVLEKRVGQYIALRDKIAQIKEEQEKALKPYTDALLKLNTVLLEHLITTGVDSVTVRGVGTVYKNTKDSATVADGAEFRRFIIGGELWDLIDWRANTPSVKAYMEENDGTPPPGLNFRRSVAVGVRRAGKSD